MEIGIDLSAAFQASLGTSRSGGESPKFDWQGLHSRCAAAHAARAVFAEVDTRFPVLAGGFADWGMQRIPEYASRAINRTDSADGKIPAGMDSGIAGDPKPGGRGQK